MSINIRVRRADGAVTQLTVPQGTTVQQVMAQIGMGDQALSHRFRSDAEDSRYERISDTDRLTQDGILALAPVAKSQLDN